MVVMVGGGGDGMAAATARRKTKWQNDRTSINFYFATFALALFYIFFGAFYSLPAFHSLWYLFRWDETVYVSYGTFLS